jgi:hypothetical protein
MKANLTSVKKEYCILTSYINILSYNHFYFNVLIMKIQIQNH